MSGRESLTIPTILTLIRLFVSPLVLPFFLVCFLPQHSLFINSLLTLLFIAFGMTDFFDGYLARKYHQETRLGMLIDPMADKALVYATLIALLAAHKIYFFWVVLLIGRDFFMIGLRSIALEYGFSIAVTSHARLKTMIQMGTLSFIILNPYQSLGIAGAPCWNGFEALLIIATLILALGSAWQYYQAFIMRVDSNFD